MTKYDHETIKRIIKEKHETGSCEISSADKKKIEEIAGQPWEKMWIGREELKRSSDEII